MTPILLDVSQIDLYLAHVARHVAESGRDQTPIFAPYEPAAPWPAQERRQPTLERWSKSLDEAGWERAWAIQTEGRFVGHLNLKTRPIRTARHRVMLGIGVEAHYRRRGLGHLLMETAVSWARAQNGIDWIDLDVFANNHSACALYRRFGFQGIGRTPDLFRVAGQEIENIAMTLRLR